jgi:hypothetical protein
MALPPSMAVLVTLVVAGLLAAATAATETNGSYRLAYTTYTDAGGVVVQVAEGTLGSGRPKITPGVVAIAGNSRGAGQLALSPSGESLAFIVWRTGSACAANADLEPGCWALATWSLAGQGGAMTLATMQGSAGLAGQPVWSPDGRSIAFVSHAAGSYWNLTVVTVATKATRTVAQIFVPASELPGTVDDPPLAWAECIRPAWLGSDSLVYVDWGVEHGRSKLFQVNTTVGGRIYNKGQQHERLDLYWYSNTTVMGPPSTGFCRPVVHPVHGTVAVAVYRHDDDRQPWHAEVLDAETYGYEGVQVGAYAGPCSWKCPMTDNRLRRAAGRGMAAGRWQRAAGGRPAAVVAAGAEAARACGVQSQLEPAPPRERDGGERCAASDAGVFLLLNVQ